MSGESGFLDLAERATRALESIAVSLRDRLPDQPKPQDQYQAALSIPCPECGAVAGMGCHNLTGSEIHHFRAVASGAYRTGFIR